MRHMQLLKTVSNYVRLHFAELAVLGVALMGAYTIAAQAIVYKHSNRTVTINEIRENTNLELSGYRVGIVFGGGGATDSGPLPIFKDRLDLAARLINSDRVDTIILSGDNRFENYNEPRVMFEYLTQEKDIDPDRLQPDYAGRSTYETCERAHKVFGLERALLVSESTHLPRALYLCSHFGIDAYGVVSEGSASSGPNIGQRMREIFARDKAVFNTTLYGERTVLGDPIPLE